MIKNEKINKKDFLLCSHQWCRELVGQYKDTDYKTQLSLCMRELIRQKKNGECNLF